MMLKSGNRAWLVLHALALMLLLSAGPLTRAQRRPPSTTGFDDVVFAISFSPDGRTLAVARGANEPSQRFGRIELWDTATEKLRHVIKGFDGPVRSVSFLPDGQTLVSGSTEFRTSKIQEKARSRDGESFGEVKWWDAQTGELKRKVTLPSEGNVSLRVTCSPDGKQLAMVASFLQFSFFSNNVPFSAASGAIDVAGLPNSPRFPGRSGPLVTVDLKLLDAETGEQKLKLKSSQPTEATFSPDGTLLAVQSGGEVKVINAQTGQAVHTLKGFKGQTNAVAFSPDGRSIAVAARKFERHSTPGFIRIMMRSEVKVFDLHTWNNTVKLQNQGAVNSLAFDPGGRYLLLGGLLDQKDGGIPALRLHDLQTGKTATFPTGGEDFSEAVGTLAVSRRGNLLAFKAGPDMVRLLDTETWKVRQTLDAKSAGDMERSASRFLMSVNRVTSLAFLPDGKSLSGEIEGSGIKVWDVRTGEVKKRFEDQAHDDSLVAMSAAGTSLAEAGADQMLRLWNITNEQKRALPWPGGESASALALSTAGQLVAVATDKEVALWNVGSGEKVFALSGHQAVVNRLAFSHDDRTLISADEGGTIKVWDTTSGQNRQTVNTGGKVTAMRLGPGGQVLASAGEDRSINLWDLAAGGLPRKLKKHDGIVNAIAFSSDGQLLASGSDDRTVIIWEAATGKSKRTLKGHDLTVLSVAFSPDGSLIASGSGNASVVLWDVKSGKLNRVLH
jgi:WD40 repeat protein